MSDQIQGLTAILSDRYRVERKVGAGAMATVYLAEDVKYHRRVAVKVLRPELATAVGSERFLREIDIAARLRHPHILPLLDSGDAEGFFFYVMPFVEGESLREKLDREKQLAIDEAVSITREVADALSYAHARGVVHRDIKPENVMLDSGHAVVTDFGVAFLVQEVASNRLTGTGLSPGTPLYMSPEQAGGGPRVDGRSDVYSLGCVLYEMLGGDPPFTGSTTQAIVARKMMESVPSVRIVRDTVSESLERVILKSLAKTPADRFKTAGEFAEALAGLPVEQIASPEHEVEEARATGKPAVGVAETRRFGLAGTAIALFAAGVVMLTVVGFLTTKVWDLKLRIPEPFTPSTTNFTYVGFRALVPFFIYVFAAIVIYAFAKYVGRFFVMGVRRIPTLEPVVDTWPRRASTRWSKSWSTVEPNIVAETFFVALVLVSIAVLARHWRFLETTMWLNDTTALSCSFGPSNGRFFRELPVVIFVMSLVRHRVFRYLTVRGHGGGTFAMARWGSAAWIVLLVLIATLPWKLASESDRERVRLDGERAYVLKETDTGLLIYRAESGSTVHYRNDDTRVLERLGIDGYLFEEPEAFESTRPLCESVTSSLNRGTNQEIS